MYTKSIPWIPIRACPFPTPRCSKLVSTAMHDYSTPILLLRHVHHAYAVFVRSPPQNAVPCCRHWRVLMKAREEECDLSRDWWVERTCFSLRAARSQCSVVCRFLHFFWSFAVFEIRPCEVGIVRTCIDSLSDCCGRRYQRFVTTARMVEQGRPYVSQSLSDTLRCNRICNIVNVRSPPTSCNPGKHRERMGGSNMWELGREAF
ncbi:hypothetical protein BDV96DRAFT_312948 [Lophiotrema nucula]|uniref:Uncharacterized protein n=1 Tax=Lophiotrema nucula TaxID=690887 RepID=A0A6A5ZM03_9PLEO|nr:hypothetical protein BDV96DRAFT_312948 [Lophiotrema nucula]